MKSTNVLATIFTLSVALATLAYAGLVVQREVWNPAVILPDSRTIWVIGHKENVTWDTSNPPSEVTDPTGEVRLRKGGIALSLILATNFSLFLGTVEVTVPRLEPGDDYSTVLFGDSGNFGPRFTIAA